MPVRRIGLAESAKKPPKNNALPAAEPGRPPAPGQCRNPVNEVQDSDERDRSVVGLSQPCGSDSHKVYYGIYLYITRSKAYITIVLNRMSFCLFVL
jgi:hypothetical protein